MSLRNSDGGLVFLRPIAPISSRPDERSSKYRWYCAMLANSPNLPNCPNSASIFRDGATVLNTRNTDLDLQPVPQLPSVPLFLMGFLSVGVRNSR